MEDVTKGLIEHGVAVAPKPGESHCGDRYLVKPHPAGVLLAVVDGLGHGEEAESAADRALKVLAGNPAESVVSLTRRCHDELRGTRGVALTLASYDAKEGTVSWLGVGNVEAVLIRGSADVFPRLEHVLLRSGVVGHHLPALYASVLQVNSGDTLILATDGIRNGFTQAVRNGDAPQLIADRILATFGTASDDALVLVGRYVDGRS
ncbi:MAG: SpoIIE family protein phosphatase [Chloroflexi bacterium]|nr:SpoIIE family protein phosphatase [Chloroflexota bacterium]